MVRLDALDAAAVHGESLLPTAAPPVPHRGSAAAHSPATRATQGYRATSGHPLTLCSAAIAQYTVVSS